MNTSNLNSLIRTILKIAGAALITHGLQKDAAWLNSEDMVGALSILIGAIWSWRHHGQAPSNSSPMNPSAIALLLLPVAALNFCGCSLFSSTSTPDQKAADVQRLCYAAASIGTQEALLQDPEWRPQFAIAYTNLDQLVSSHVITGTLLRNVISSLPVKELKSDQARVAIEGATILFDSYAGTSIDIETNVYMSSARLLGFATA